MKSSTSVTSATKFTRYATASAAALGAATAEAQFGGDYSLTSPSPVVGNYTFVASGATFGGWTAIHNATGTGSANVGTLSAPAALNLALFSNTNFLGAIETFDFVTVAQTDLNVSFLLQTSTTGVLAPTFAYTADYGTFTPISAAGTAALVSFFVADGDSFGFRLTVGHSYLASSSIQAFIFGFSATTAVPEAGTSGLLAGCAALGFVALVGARKARQRTA